MKKMLSIFIQVGFAEKEKMIQFLLTHLPAVSTERELFSRNFLLPF